MEKFCNLNINVLQPEDFLLWDKGFKHFCTLNAQIIRLANENEKMFEIVNSTWNSIDGTWPLWFFRVVNQGKNAVKISGSDYLPRIIERCVKLEKRIFFLGGSEIPTKSLVNDINVTAEGLADYFCGPIESYPFSEKLQKDIIHRLEKFRPEILIVSYGAPKQEFWIRDNATWLKENDVRAAYGLGGSVDMMYAPYLKAPAIVSDIGLESIWRIIVQPFEKKRWNRLFYSFGFFKYIFFTKFRTEGKR